MCVGYMERREEEETKSREKKREREERDRQRARGAAGIVFLVFISAGAEGAPQGRNTHVTVPYGHAPVTPSPILPDCSGMALYGTVIHPHSLFCGCSALRY